MNKLYETYNKIKNSKEEIDNFILDLFYDEVLTKKDKDDLLIYIINFFTSKEGYLLLNKMNLNNDDFKKILSYRKANQDRIISIGEVLLIDDRNYMNENYKCLRKLFERLILYEDGTYNEYKMIIKPLEKYKYKNFIYTVQMKCLKKMFIVFIKLLEEYNDKYIDILNDKLELIGKETQFSDIRNKKLLFTNYLFFNDIIHNLSDNTTYYINPSKFISTSTNRAIASSYYKINIIYLKYINKLITELKNTSIFKLLCFLYNIQFSKYLKFNIYSSFNHYFNDKLYIKPFDYPWKNLLKLIYFIKDKNTLINIKSYLKVCIKEKMKYVKDDLFETIKKEYNENINSLIPDKEQSPYLIINEFDIKDLHFININDFKSITNKYIENKLNYDYIIDYLDKIDLTEEIKKPEKKINDNIYKFLIKLIDNSSILFRFKDNLFDYIFLIFNEIMKEIALNNFKDIYGINYNFSIFYYILNNYILYINENYYKKEYPEKYIKDINLNDIFKNIFEEKIIPSQYDYIIKDIIFNIFKKSNREYIYLDYDHARYEGQDEYYEELIEYLKYINLNNIINNKIYVNNDLIFYLNFDDIKNKVKLFDFASPLCISENEYQDEINICSQFPKEKEVILLPNSNVFLKIDTSKIEKNIYSYTTDNATAFTDSDGHLYKYRRITYDYKEDPFIFNTELPTKEIISQQTSQSKLSGGTINNINFVGFSYDNLKQFYDDNTIKSLFFNNQLIFENDDNLLEFKNNLLKSNIDDKFKNKNILSGGYNSDDFYKEKYLKYKYKYLNSKYH